MESTPRASDAEPASGNRILEISNRLTTTLDLESLLQVFESEIQKNVPHDGLTYSDPDSQSAVILGQKSLHRCQYSLEVNNQDLGTLAFLRKTPFSQRELRHLEDLSVALVYPLRNALMYRQALHSALKDPLTGANNRAALDSALNRDRLLARRQELPLSVILLDIDHFKRVNDQYGHPCGDAALRAVANCTAQTFRGSDLLFRYGGEEFVVLLSNTDLDGAALLAERLRQAIEALEIHCDGHIIRVTASLGVTMLDEQEDTGRFLSRADRAMYRAKHNGRNRVELDRATAEVEPPA